MRCLILRGWWLSLPGRSRLLLVPGLLVLVLGMAGCVSPLEMIVNAADNTPTPVVSPTPAEGPTILLTPATGGLGTRIIVSGQGWRPGDTVYLDLEDPASVTGPQTAYAGAVVTDDGSFALLMTFPDDERWANLPVVLVTAWSSGTGRKVSAEFTLSANAGTPGAIDTPDVTQTPGAGSTPTLQPVATATPSLGGDNVGLVTTANLNVRQGPSVAYPVVRTLPAGSRFEVTGQNGSGDWLQVVMADGRAGWLYRSYTDYLVSTPVVSVPPLPAPTATPVPTSAPIVIDAWRGEYFTGRELQGAPVLVRNDTDLNFAWGNGAPSAVLPADGFSARWTRTLTFSGGTYRFYARSDDGVRAWLDGQLIIDQWRDGGSTTFFAERSLGSGLHTLRVEYYENTGSASLQFWWERLADFPQWQGEYYPNATLSGDPSVVRNDLAVDFNWGRGTPVGGLPADNFSVRWTRTLSFDEGMYRLHALVDDGVRVYVDGNLVIDEWRDGSRREVTGDYRPGSGDHNVRIEYYAAGANASIHVWWERITTYPDWRGAYWMNAGLEGSPALVRNDRTINFDWGGGSPASGLPADNFSAEWTRSVSIDTGTYRFHVLADDGARLWVDDQLLIDQWHDGSLREATYDYAVTGGTHNIRLDYYERTGSARVKLWWEVAPNVDFPDWRGEYWPNQTLSGVATLVRADKSVDFDWGSNSPAYGLPGDHFSARWSRWMDFAAGNWRFYAQADDGIRVYVDGNLVLNQWHDAAGGSPYTVDLNLSGLHWMTVEYYENTGAASARFWIEPAPAQPTSTPTATATSLPPTRTPTAAPTLIAPTEAPTRTPRPTRVRPTRTPTATEVPPTETPTHTPTPVAPIETPTHTPTASPTLSPTATPTAGDEVGGSATPTPTPTVTAVAPGRVARVLINEVMARPGEVDWNDDGAIDQGDQWIELYNPGRAGIDIGGWWLETGREPQDVYLVPAHTVIEPGGFLVLYGSDTGVVLDAEQGGAWLIAPGRRTIDRMSYDHAEDGVSFSRDNRGRWRDSGSPTPGSANGPALPPN